MDTKISEKEIKQLELGILDYVDSICKKHNLSYNLDYGSLLGAIRHKGFIPWDDDIDISMPRIDYEKLIRIISTDNSRYKVLSSENSDGYFYEYAKIVDSKTLLKEANICEIKDLGVWIDVFPRDYIPKYYCVVKYIILFLVVMRIFSVQSRFPEKRSFVFYPLWIIARIIGYKPFLQLSTKIVKPVNRRNGSKVGFLCDIICNKALVWDKEIFEDIIFLPFEDKMCPVPRKYDTYLKGLYGNYMQLPSEDERVAHTFDVYWKQEKQ